MPGPSPVRLPLGGRSALLTYEPYYGLKEKPFSLSVDPRFLYKSRSHAPVFDDLLAGIRRREGLIVLTGDIGTGKTTLCRAVLDSLDRKTFSTFVPDPFLSREDLLKMLLIDFGVMSVEDLKSGRLTGASRPDLSYPLYEFLNALVPLQAFAVLIIDEAQNLPLSLLEEIRILSDLEAPEKLLQVVLVGQLELQGKLKLPEMRQVDQRVSVRCNLEALNRDAIAGYITHRLQIAGGSSDRVSFAPEAVDFIARRSGGVPRLINLICDRSLYRGHLARAAVIDADVVRVAMMDLGLAGMGSVAAMPTALLEPLLKPERTASPPEGVPTADPAKSPDEIAFDEHDLIHADQATPLEQPPPPAETKPEPASPSAAAPVDQPLLFETRGTWTGQSVTLRRRLRRRSRHLALAAVALAIISFAAYWQAQWNIDLESAFAPDPPASPYESFALTFQSKRVAAPFVATRTILPVMAPVPRATTVPAGSGVFAIDVALFNSAARASILVDELAGVGYRAHVKELHPGDRGSLYEVEVGPFETRAQADAEAGRIRARPGYGDARVVPPTPLTQP